MPAKKRTDKRWRIDKRQLVTLKKVENLLNYCFSWRFSKSPVSTSVKISISLDNTEQIVFVDQKDFDNSKYKKLNALDFYLIWRWFKADKYDLSFFSGKKMVFADNPVYSQGENKTTAHYICLEESQDSGWFYRVRALTYIKANDYKVACLLKN